MSAAAERARVLLDNAQSQLDREAQIIAVVQILTDHIKQRDGELAELRDELLALSNRIEAVQRGSRAVADTLLAHETDTTHAHRS